MILNVSLIVRLCHIRHTDFPIIDVLDGVRNMVLKDGSKALWRGLPPTLWRDVPFSAIYWMGYEECKLFLEAQANHNLLMSDLQITFLAGALSGMVRVVN